MSTMTLKGAKGEGDFFRLRFWGAVLLVLGALLALGAFPAHAAPLAGTSIGNQASASYTDANAVSRITVSNSVSTIVQAIGSASLTQSQTKVGAPGQTIAFAHTITNTGNGPDTFAVSLGAKVDNVGGPTGAFVTAGTGVYADANCDGVADNNTVVNSIGPVAPGGQSCFVTQVTLGTTAGNDSQFSVNINSSIAGALISPFTNTDRVSISANAVINVSKSVDISTGPSGTIATYTLTYRNTGTVSSGNVVIADTLPSNAGYIVGSATWSGFVGTTLTDNELDGLQGTAGNQIEWGLVGQTAVANSGVTVGGTVYAILERVDPGVQGTIQFRARLTGTGPLTINNSANWCYSDIGTGGTIVPASTGTLAAGSCFNVRASIGAGAAALTNFTALNGITHSGNTNKSNIVPFFIPSVGATGNLVYNDAGATLPGTTNGGNATTAADGAITPATSLALLQAINDSNNDIAVATAGQGTVASWDTTVWNTGSGTDSFNIYVPTSGTAVNNFPAGTSFLLFRNDGFTPLTDSNNDGVLDTGPVANGSRYMVRVVAILPPSGVGTYEAIVTAQSSNTPTATNSVGVRVRVLGSRVDLRNNPFTGTSSSDGTGNGGPAGFGETLAVTGGIVSANPNSLASFLLSVDNTGAVPDSFNLSWNATSGNYTTLDAFTTPNALPNGFVVKFYRTIGNAATCATADLGPEVSNTGVIQPGGPRQNYCAVVTVPAGATAASYELFFRAVSPTTWNGNPQTSSGDVLHNRLTVNLLRSVAIAPNNSGQGFPGGSVQYCHTVTNSGNSNETGLSVVQSAQSLNGTTGWGEFATIYRDSNDNCVLDGTENATPVTTPLTLGIVTAGASVRFIVVVQVPGAAVAGQTNISTFTLTSSNGATVTQAIATDTTNVVLGQVSLVKDQRLDPTGVACSTTFDATTLEAAPFAALFTQTQITTGAVPGACIIYRVRATNVGTQSVTNVTINDVAPPNTTRHANAISGATNSCTPDTPAPVAVAPAVKCTIATLTGGSTTTMFFRVKIDP